MFNEPFARVTKRNKNDFFFEFLTEGECKVRFFVRNDGTFQLSPSKCVTLTGSLSKLTITVMKDEYGEECYGSIDVINEQNIVFMSVKIELAAFYFLHEHPALRECW